MDAAGNFGVGRVSVNIDLTPPVIMGSASPAPNANGWNNTPVTVAFACLDALSGVACITNNPTVLDGEGIDQAATGVCTDAAGNAASATVDNIDLDLTAPTISGSRTPPPNAAGWNNTAVTVDFDCTDDRSGVVGLTNDPTVLTTEGADQSATSP